MPESWRKALQSIASSVIGIGASLLALALLLQQTDIVELPSWWAAGVAIITTVTTVARTVLVWLNPKDDSYGVTSASLAERKRRRRLEREAG